LAESVNFRPAAFAFRSTRYLVRVIWPALAKVLLLPPVSSCTLHRQKETPSMSTWLTWTIAALAGWALLSLVVALVLGHVFRQLGATSTTVTQIHEEAELAGWSAAPLTRHSGRTRRVARADSVQLQRPRELTHSPSDE